MRLGAVRSAAAGTGSRIVEVLFLGKDGLVVVRVICHGPESMARRWPVSGGEWPTFWCMEPAAEPRPVKQGRPAVIVLIAFVVELVVIAALANQVVTKHLVSYSKDHPYAFPGRLVAAMTTYQWRVSSQPGDRANEPLAHACLDVVVLVLTALLVLLLTRGAITFFRAFFATWLAVIVATLVGQVVLGVVSPPPYPQTYSNGQGAIFLMPNGFGLVAGVVLGFVTALFAAIFAVATRRTLRPAAGGPLPSERPSDRPYPADYQSEYPSEYRGDYPPDYRDDREAGRVREDWSDRTAAYPRGDYGGYYGGQVGAPAAPTPYAPGGGYAGASAAGGEQTQRVAPSDEEQGAATQSLRTVGDVPQREAAPAAEAAPAREAAAGDEPASGEIPADAGPATEAMPAAEAGPATEAMPATEAASESSETSAGDAPTQAFPRPPDDEDIGQHPDHHDL